VVLPWHDVPVVQLLEKATGLPVVIDNSARCAALAEIWHSKAQYASVRNLLYVGVSTGLACGVVIDGGLYRGKIIQPDNSPYPIDLSGPECRCGQRAAGSLRLRQSDSRSLPQIAGGSGKRQVTMRRLVELVESGDQTATEAVRETARYLGIGITGLINVWIRSGRYWRRDH